MTMPDTLLTSYPVMEDCLTPDIVEDKSEEAEEEKIPRERKMTEKGLEYTQQSKKKRLNQLCSALDKLNSSIIDMLATEVDDEVITKAYKRWINLFDNFLTTSKTYRELLLGEARAEFGQDWYSPRHAEYTEFKVAAEEWLNMRKRIPDTQVQDEDNISEFSHRSISSKSSKHSTSSSSSRAESERKQAVLKTQLSLLEKKKQLEKEKLEHKIKQEELQLQEELALSRAESEVYDNSPDGRDIHDSNASNNSMLLSVVQHLNKPAAEIQKLSGDPMQYQRFIRQFKTRIVAHCGDYDERLTYLEQYTTGEAKKIVMGYSYMNGKRGYEAALKEFEERYGNSDLIVQSFVKKLLDWPSIKPDNTKSLDEFSLLLAECYRAVEDLEAVKVLEYTENFKRIVSKLPYSLHDKWRSIVTEKREHGKKFSFGDLVTFVSRESKKANDPTFGREALKEEPKIPNKSSKGFAKRSHGSFATKVSDIKEESSHKTKFYTSTSATAGSKDNKQTYDKKPSAFGRPCSHCKGPHPLEECDRLKDMPYSERIDVLKPFGYCFGCLRSGHSRRYCRNKAVCKYCQGRHPSILHIENKPQVQEEEKIVMFEESPPISSACMDAKKIECFMTESARKECTMAIIPVKIRVPGSTFNIATYAFMDPGSNVSFITEELMYHLGVEGKHKKLSIETMGVPHTMRTYEIKNLELTDLEEQNVVPLPTVYTKDQMPVSQGHIPTRQNIHKWPHLRDIKLPQISANIGLLIGNDVPDALAPMEVRVGARGAPYAARSALGWIPWNVIREMSVPPKSVNRADVRVIENLQETQDLNLLYLNSLRLDFPERQINDRKENSIEDEQFLRKLLSSKRKDNGHYEFCLPFRHENPSLPDNRSLALHRLQSLRRKLLSNQQFYNDYCKFMELLMEKGFAEKVPGSNLHRSDQKVWYLPHHGVYHPNKPSKIRVVFDCSAKYRNTSLNDLLLKGPDLTNSLVGVLLKFRQERYAVIGDIEKMFYQVRVAEEDRDCLRFYWWNKGNLHEPPTIFRMTVHIFGAISSPSCCSFALQQTVHDHSSNYDSSVTEAALSNFYVDDFLCSRPSEDDAIGLVSGIVRLLKQGGFYVTKWLSNSRSVLETIPDDDRATGVANLDLEKLPSERALGVFWDIDCDTLEFRLKQKDCLLTRRTMLSILSSVYDPLGLVSPAVLPGRIILQELAKDGIDWDSELPEHIVHKWTQWMQRLSMLNENFRVPRCLRPRNCDNICQIELHHFADASNVGYGTVSYVRFEDSAGQFHCSLVMGKSRVAPIQKVTIPRMEVTAATLAVKLNRFLTQQLQYSVTSTYFWTDSMAVLRYIWNTTSRFQTFIANRLAIIHDGSDVSQWRFVDGSLNPADLASRGLDITRQNDVKLWMEGPGFLWMPQSQWPTLPDEDYMRMYSDLEIKRSSNVSVTSSAFLDSVIVRYSDWAKLKRILAWILFFIRCIQVRIQGRGIDSTVNNRHVHIIQKQAAKDLALPTDILQEVETIFIKHAQQEAFAAELEDLTQRGKVKQTSPISKLDPFLQDGIIRVGGRLAHSSLSHDAKHQILLPQKCTLSALILKHVHKKVGHLGRSSMLAELRQRFWIPHAISAIKQLVGKCVICRKYQARKQEQKMADLPQERVTGDEPPFSHAGMDFFGPIEVKRGRSTCKRYGVIFTCCTSRAVHLEIAASLDTDSCVNAVRRFLARRGPVQSIRSDNGTNLVGAEREMRQEIAKWNQSKIGKLLQQQDIKWEFNPPSASHFGGFWERLIRSIRKVLNSLLKEHFVRLDDEGLHTVMCEVEHILNNRPLTATSEDPNDLEVLTPNHLLLMKPTTSLPPGVFNETDSYAKRRWRQIQYITNVFWSRWTREYLPLLQERQKWLKPRQNLEIGDIVLIIDNTPRHVWLMGRVIETHKDMNGMVRVVTLKTKLSVLKRPISKLCRILEGNKN